MCVCTCTKYAHEYTQNKRTHIHRDRETDSKHRGECGFHPWTKHTHTHTHTPAPKTGDQSCPAHQGQPHDPPLHACTIPDHCQTSSVLSFSLFSGGCALLRMHTYIYTYTCVCMYRKMLVSRPRMLTLRRTTGVLPQLLRVPSRCLLSTSEGWACHVSLPCVPQCVSVPCVRARDQSTSGCRWWPLLCLFTNGC
mgnify:CR=1 FL=1